METVDTSVRRELGLAWKDLGVIDLQNECFIRFLPLDVIPLLSICTKEYVSSMSSDVDRTNVLTIVVHNNSCAKRAHVNTL
jgi:hypothetical protein